MPIPVKLTRAHQVTLPKKLLERAGWLKQEFFVAELKGNYLLLKPLSLEPSPQAPMASFEDLRRHFARIGITRKEIHRAVRWARRAERVARRRH
ncbi:MAG: hypothetical protein HYZ93_06895 [Candidatus Omnitrophica bacterium]|nr:hypothetical protein [Candidatus Omnitrophota bacterium]